MQPTLKRQRIVLLGVGHTNAHVVRQWSMNPLPGAELICVTNFWHATYSGMLPGVLSRQYEADALRIDLLRLCRSAGARLVNAELSGIDRGNRELLFRDRPPLAYDWLSIGMGSQPTTSGVEFDEQANWLVIKPMQTFLRRLEIAARKTLERVGSGSRAINLVVVGGGVGGLEVAMCLPNWWRERFPNVAVSLQVVHRSEMIAPGVSAGTRSELQKALSDRGVVTRGSCRAVCVQREQLVVSPSELVSSQSATSKPVVGDGLDTIPSDLVIWATGASPPDVLREFDLPKDESGFLLTETTLCSTGDSRIFAVGDSGSIAGESLPKAGVYAVRQGPILWENLQRSLKEWPLREYQPQRTFLKLINVGDGSAIADYRGWSLRHPLAWRWKDRIDRRFLRMYQEMEPMKPAAQSAMGPTDEAGRPKMFCAGCGSKVGARLLQRVLQRLAVEQPDVFATRTDALDDVALIPAGAGSDIAWTVDYFTSPIQEPVIAGRIAALHAASDLQAKGLEPSTALAILQLPHGDPVEQERWLYETLAGAAVEFQQMGCRLVGGHTIEAEQFAVGFSMMTSTSADVYRSKTQVEAGDLLVLTQGLGTGVLLAADAMAECRAEWWSELLRAMLTSNAPAGRLASRLGAHAVTDITGFGLAGHLQEMVGPSCLQTQVALDAIPLLDGVTELIAAGVESSLAPANRWAEEWIQPDGGSSDPTWGRRVTGDPRYAALFDPQTCGGLLIALPPTAWSEWLKESQAAGIETHLIGCVGQGQADHLRLVRHAAEIAELNGLKQSL